MCSSLTKTHVIVTGRYIDYSALSISGNLQVFIITDSHVTHVNTVNTGVMHMTVGITYNNLDHSCEMA